MVTLDRKGSRKMCLIVDEEKTQKMKKEKGWRTVWKVLKIRPSSTDNGADHVMSPFQPGHYWKSGRTICNRPTAKYPYKHKGSDWQACPDDFDYKGCGIRINSGIYVCLTRQAAREYVKEMKKHDHKNLVIFRCRTHIISLIAVGTCDYFSFAHDKMAVFHNVHISPEDWDKALNGDFR